MPYQLEPFADVGLAGAGGDGAGRQGALLDLLIRDHESASLPILRTLWTYYRNPMSAAAGAGRRIDAPGARGPGGRLYRLGQERGLPPRLTGWGGPRPDVNTDDRAASRREIVIENDIAWRVHTMVDFMFGRPVTILSTAPDQKLRRRIQRALEAVWEASGGIALMQDIGLLGHVYGHVDLLVRAVGGAGGAGGASGDGGADDAAGAPTDTAALDAAGAVRIEVVVPTRGIPLLNPRDFRAIDAYIVRYEREGAQVQSAAAPAPRTSPGFLGRLLFGRDSAGWEGGGSQAGAGGRRCRVMVTEIFSGSHRQLYEDDGSRAGPVLVEDEPNAVSPGAVPVAHIQNISQPLSYAGLGEVEPLIPLQDELNTRLSDRAGRVTMQSFKMYIARGLEGLDRLGVSPGQIFTTESADASVQTFGGDAGSGGPGGETEHIEQVREAMDKTSGVPPLASGVVRAKIGNLSSENALRITLMGLLSKTARKRVTYGRGIAETCRLVLTALDHAGILPTTPADRAVRVEWPDPLPREERDVLAAALTKVELGISRDRVLAELGYGIADPGVV